MKNAKYYKYLIYLPLIIILVLGAFDKGDNDYGVYYLVIFIVTILMAIILWRYRNIKK
jgi:L-asparagine transporter-like permease